MKKILKYATVIVWVSLGLALLYEMIQISKSFYGDVRNVRVYSMVNENHTLEDMDMAVEAVKNYFISHSYGSRLEEIWYGKDYELEREVSAQFDHAEVIILRSKYYDFTGRESKWRWVVVDVGGSKWEVQNWGYSDRDEIDTKLLNF